ncbi:DUF397 domain-containing protein [Streptomyces chumphonensis]|uniref:DUF397 domain-containing protein n=1 Tax=Streptomyces chumphonensis TaxID=1214925 RepID=UPI003D738CCC
MSVDLIASDRWFKSSYSSGEPDSDCVEIMDALDAVYIRDSKAKSGPTIAVPPTAWADFISFAAKG